MVKVAVRYGLAQRVPVRIFGAGAHGIGGQEQLARYAAILGVPFQAWESYESVHLALNGDQWKGITLIDTPGISPLDREGLSELGSFVSRRQEVETHLVLRADSRSADMSHVVSRFKPSRLLFAGADEALEAGAMIQTLIATGIPATFVGTGQEIPDDLAEVDARGLAERLFGRKAFAAIAA
jgi:flagellar biosynthesis protein FlhF